MLTPEMLDIVTDNHERLGYSLTDTIMRLRRMPGCTSTSGAEYRPGTPPQLPRSLQRRLTDIICSTAFCVGDRVTPTAAAHQRSSSSASLLALGDVGVITHIRWPNSENCGQLVIQADFAERNYHFNARELQRA